jgi:hypothetical protein
VTVMVTMLAWLYVASMVAVPAVLVLLSTRKSRPKLNLRLDQEMVESHAIRCRLDVSQFEAELRRDAIEAQRALQADLCKLSEREGS